MTPALSPRRLANAATAVLRTAATDPASLRYLGAWIRSLAGERTPLGDATPWIVFKARRWLEARLGPDLTVFEWGSGGSTRFFADRVRRVVSIEHDPAWHARTTAALTPEQTARCDYRLIAPEPLAGAMPAYGPGSYTSTDRDYAGRSFERYVRAIDAFDEESLDVVLVDGRARASCLAHAAPRVRPGGLLVLDNAERAEYAPAIAALRDFERHDFDGIGPYQRDPWRTTIWRVPERRRHS